MSVAKVTFMKEKCQFSIWYEDRQMWYFSDRLLELVY